MTRFRRQARIIDLIFCNAGKHGHRAKCEIQLENDKHCVDDVDGMNS